MHLDIFWFCGSTCFHGDTFGESVYVPVYWDINKLSRREDKADVYRE